jgi:aspartate dehydrogenase
MATRRIGLIGCGTIGSSLAQAIDSGKVPNASLVSLFDVLTPNVKSLQAKLNRQATGYADFIEFLNSETDMVVEAASQEAVKHFAIQVLDHRKDLMIMSVVALADSDFHARLLDSARKKGCRIYIPSGAIAGIDAIRSVRELIESITLTTTKSPKALAGAPFFHTFGKKPEEITQKTEIFSGPASEAVKLFPANVNVAAVLSLAGIGPDRTQVRIVADPSANTNEHTIVAKGSFGEIKISVNNAQSPGNPKTSYLAVLSAVECLRSICDDFLTIGS